MSKETDADLAAEALSMQDTLDLVPQTTPSLGDPEAAALEFVPLAMSGNSFAKSRESALLLRRIGGGGVVHRLIDLFYSKMFRDKHLDQFVRSHEDPHATRLANWIIEKMGGEGDVWSRERVERAKCPVTVNLPGLGAHFVHDRTSAHSAAWVSPKRPKERLGDHFKLHDVRVWMRLMFWSAREIGVFDDPVFESWYVRFIGHFVRVYERMGPYFARDSARWSLKPDNIREYNENGNMMLDVLGPRGIGTSVAEAVKQVPAREINDSVWPYNRSE